MRFKLLAALLCLSTFNTNYVLAANSQVDVIETTTTNTKTTTKTTTETFSSSSRPIKVGLALGGGGSRGSAHVGVLKVLVEEGVPIDMIAGTSIGSVVGGFYASGLSLDKIGTEFTKDSFIKEFMPLPLFVRIMLLPIVASPRLIGIHPYDGIYRGTIFKHYAERMTNNAVIEKLQIPFAAICTNIVDGKSYRIDHGDLGLAMQASTAVPGLKKPVVIEDKLYCDGGLICNVPVEHVKAMGADFVIAVNIDETLVDVPIKTFTKMGSMPIQALRITLNDDDARYCDKADVTIHPDTNGITLISRKQIDGKDGIANGVKAARAAMPDIKRKLLAMGIKLTPTVSGTGVLNGAGTASEAGIKF